MSSFSKLVEIAMRVDELLLHPANMAAARELAVGCLRDPMLGCVDALQFPDGPYALPGPEGVGEQSSTLTSGQIALILAALHDLHCPGVEKVISFPDLELEITEDESRITPSCFHDAVRWEVILGRVRKLEDDTVPWFTRLLRRFERNLTEQALGQDTQSDLTKTAEGGGSQANPEGPRQGEGGKPTADRSKGIPLDEAETRVREWLVQHAKENHGAVTRDAIAVGTGISTGQVSNTTAWKTFRDHRNAKAKPSVREIPLSERMQANLPANCSRPDELAALIDEQRADAAEDERRHTYRHKPS